MSAVTVPLVITVVTLLISAAALVYVVRKGRRQDREHDQWVTEEMRQISAERDRRRRR